jgi:hypothetical protein
VFAGVNISAHVAFQAALCAFGSILLWLACAGVGLQILPAADVERPADAPASWRHAGVAACVGLGALLAIAGVGVLIGVPWWLYVVPFFAAGLALECRRFAGIAFRSVPRSFLVIGGCVLVAFALVAFIESIVGLRFPLNACDDLRGYLPLARRLLDTGNLNEPWSAHRVQSLGGFDLLRALPIAGLGDSAVGVAETAIASVFLAGMFVANGLRATWARLLGIGLILAIIFAWVPRANTTGVLMGVPLLVSMFAITAEMRSAYAAQRAPIAARFAAAGGLIIASLMALRPTLGLAGALIVALGALVIRGVRVGARVGGVVAAATATILAVASWSIAMFRTVGTPLYPAFNGNLNTAAMQQPAVDLSHRLRHAGNLLGSGPYSYVVLGVVVVALAAWRFLPDATLVLLGAAVVIFVTFLTTVQAPQLSGQLLARYAAPLSEALSVFLVCELMREFDARQFAAGFTTSGAITCAALVSVAVVLMAGSYSTLNFQWRLLPSGIRLVQATARESRRSVAVDSHSLAESYRAAVESTRGQRTIAGVDRPYLIDYKHFDIPSLDAPGFMTPSGTFRYFAGPAATIADFRKAGYQVLLVTDPRYEICLAPPRLLANETAYGNGSAVYAEFLAWEEGIETIERHAPRAVQRFGTVLRIDLARAQADLTS